MKNNLFIFFLALSVNLYSQESTPKDSLWTTKGNVAVLLNQTGFSDWVGGCLLYTSPSPRDVEESRMPSSA